MDHFFHRDNFSYICVEKKIDIKILEKIVLFFSVGQFLVHMCGENSRPHFYWKNRIIFFSRSISRTYVWREKIDTKINQKIRSFFSVGQFLVHMCGEKRGSSKLIKKSPQIHRQGKFLVQMCWEKRGGSKLIKKS